VIKTPERVKKRWSSENVDINQLEFLDKFSSFQGRSKKPKPLVAITRG
jgi:hypothetical protein